MLRGLSEPGARGWIGARRGYRASEQLASDEECILKLYRQTSKDMPSGRKATMSLEIWKMQGFIGSSGSPISSSSVEWVPDHSPSALVELLKREEYTNEEWTWGYWRAKIDWDEKVIKLDEWKGRTGDQTDQKGRRIGALLSLEGGGRFQKFWKVKAQSFVVWCNPGSLLLGVWTDGSEDWWVEERPREGESFCFFCSLVELR